MDELFFQPNESILLTNDNVTIKTLQYARTGEMILTNLNLYFIRKKFTGKIKDLVKISLGEIKIYNGNVSVNLGKDAAGMPRMEISADNGQAFFQFNNMPKLLAKKEIVKWADTISMEIMGIPANIPEAERGSKQSVEAIAKDIKGAIDTFAGVFGATINDASKATVSKKCKSCHAPLSGKRGEKITCPYCDTEQLM